MSIEGLWTGEIYGLNGWENTGVVVLRSGHAMGGGRHHYSIGTYNLADGRFSMSLALEYHGPPRTLFGSSQRKLSINVDGQFEGGEIQGSVFRDGSPSQSLDFRLTKRAEMP